VPTVEKYHAGALPGFVLLVTGGLLFLTSKLPARRASALSMAEAKVPHVLDRWCYPEEWGTSWSKKPFDQFFLSGQYRLTPTSVTSVPLAQPSTTDPFTWRRGDIVRLDPAGGPQ